jgi:uncharacterized protein (DUF849 family)
MARRDAPVIIEVAVNGGTRKDRNPHVPVSVDELVEDALSCLAGGAQIIHQHDDLGRQGQLGGGSPQDMAAKSLAVYERVLERFPAAILYPTANWDGDIQQRWGHHFPLADKGVLRAAYVDPGSLNLGAAGPDGIPGGAFGFLYDNSFDDVRWKFEQCERLRLGPSMAIFEPGFLRTALAYERAGRMPAGAFVKLYFGDALGFGLPPTPTGLRAYLEILADSRLPWAVAVLGGDVVESGMARQALQAGGPLRVGLEDFAGPRQPRNRELLDEAVSLCAEVGRPLATPRQTAEILGLPRLLEST